MEHLLHGHDFYFLTPVWVKGQGNLLLSPKSLVFLPVNTSAEKQSKTKQTPKYHDKDIMMMNSGLNWY